MSDLWSDPYGPSVERGWKHGPWAGMPARQDWNSSPSLRPCQTCIECGYKWDQQDFTYASHPTNGPDVHQICWNCWMVDNNPEKVTKHWQIVDKVDGSHKKPDTSQPKKAK